MEHFHFLIVAKTFCPHRLLQYGKIRSYFNEGNDDDGGKLKIEGLTAAILPSALGLIFASERFFKGDDLHFRLQRGLTFLNRGNETGGSEEPREV